jgi:hypothetical protein
VGQKEHCPLQLLQQQLRDEIEHVKEVAGLSPEELVEELREVQLWIAERSGKAQGAGASSSSGWWRWWPQAAGGGAGGDGRGQLDKSEKGMDGGLEEFLVEQVRLIIITIILQQGNNNHWRIL